MTIPASCRAPPRRWTRAPSSRRPPRRRCARPGPRPRRRRYARVVVAACAAAAAFAAIRDSSGCVGSDRGRAAREQCARAALTAARRAPALRGGAVRRRPGRPRPAAGRAGRRRRRLDRGTPARCHRRRRPSRWRTRRGVGGGAPRRASRAGLAVFRWALSAPNAGGAVSRRPFTKAARRPRRGNRERQRPPDSSREQLFRAALLGRVASLDNDAATANDAWAVVLEAVAAGRGPAGAASRRWRRWRGAVDERFDAETAEWASTRAWELPTRRRRATCPPCSAAAWARRRASSRSRGCVGPGSGPPRAAGAGGRRDLMRLRLIRDEAQRERAHADAAADARAAGAAPRAGTASRRARPTSAAARWCCSMDGGLDLIIGDEDASPRGTT